MSGIARAVPQTTRPFTSDDFVEAYNSDAKPFVWTKSEVHQKRLKPRFADQ
jgi:hypothetical protein